MTNKEYPTLTTLMSGREPGSVKVRRRGWSDDMWFRPGRFLTFGQWSGSWFGLNSTGDSSHWSDDSGSWLLVSEDAPALDTLRLQIAAQVLAALHSMNEIPVAMNNWTERHAYALAEADALIKAAREVKQ